MLIIMKFLQGKLYKKYFPIMSASIFYEMDEKEFNVLTRWIRNIETDVWAWNFTKRKQVEREGGGLYREVIFTYQKPVEELYLLLKNKQLSKLDKDDLEFINDVLYRHKYNSIISSFVFPIRRNDIS